MIIFKVSMVPANSVVDDGKEKPSEVEAQVKEDNDLGPPASVNVIKIRKIINSIFSFYFNVIEHL